MLPSYTVKRVSIQPSAWPVGHHVILRPAVEPIKEDVNGLRVILW